ncbi:MAG: hypothetical protein A2161_03630 [Candidatus Schekmanbacteria bacterium RBG_13_48_7]|uniref:Outer membrane lipoprotein-sorting protein n=1 Tax=Candidatus Schekmanbacteria bacterium RBG_13_48_7 TaxID=1817878 RepID=A0A1F7RP58_9BACT|nr:MAG: hypothetical protein A2161_03630 [Candidatus Schekmanbacteria bacterium RBG_13_48_7]
MRCFRLFCVIAVFLVFVILMANIDNVNAKKIIKQQDKTSILKNILQKSREYHGYSAWTKKKSVWSANSRKQFDINGNEVMQVSEIQCYLLKPQLKIFTETLERLPLTVKIFDGIKFNVWHNGKLETDDNVLRLARFQSFWDFVLSNFPFIALNPKNNYQSLGQSRIKGVVYEKIRVVVNREVFPETPHNWYLIYINSVTGQIQKAYGEIAALEFSGMVQMIEFESYFETEGIKIPQKLSVFLVSGEELKVGPFLEEITRENISFKRSIPDDLFDSNFYKFLQK